MQTENDDVGKAASHEHTIEQLEQMVTMMKAQRDAGTHEQGVPIKGKSQGDLFDVRKMGL